jgi:hypothetical protein
MSFKQYLQEAQVNAHMTHISDLVFIAGVDGTRKAVNYLRDLRNMFGHTQRNVYTVKFDGAPAIICGIDPTDGKFFVAKKGIFNKNPKVYKTQADIDADLSGELAEKFTILLRELPSLGIKSGIYQGDLMFTHDDLKTETIDGQEMVVFHPNTIAYAVPKDSELGAKIMRAKIGMVFHTTYTGNNFANLKANFGKDIVHKFAKTDNVWAIDATLNNQTANFTLSAADYAMTEFLLKDIGLQFQKIPSALLNQFSRNEEMRDVVLIYINSLVRQNIKDINPVDMSRGFHKFINDRYEKEIAKRKTHAAQSALNDKRLQALGILHVFSDEQWASVFELAKSIDLLKDILLTKMRKVGGLSHFIRTSDGFRVTNPEGFVAINTSGEAIKLVDRFEFSTSNFDPRVIKGWQR